MPSANYDDDAVVIEGDLAHDAASSAPATAISFEVSGFALLDDLLACIEDQEHNNHENIAVDGPATVVKRIENLRVQKHVEKGCLRKRRIQREHGSTTRTIFSFSTDGPKRRQRHCR